MRKATTTTKKSRMKTKVKLNADGTASITSIRVKDMGELAIIATKKIERARDAFESMEVEFDQDEYTGRELIRLINKCWA